jgi:hypothetical protein
LLPSGRSGYRRHLVAVRAEVAADDGPTVPWLSLPRLWVVVVLGAIGVMQLATTPSAIDLAYHVKASELMVEQRSVLRSDPLAWPAAGGPWLDQHWGVQLLLYGIWRVGGSRWWRSSVRCLPWPPGGWWRRPAGDIPPASAWSPGRCWRATWRRCRPCRPGRRCSRCCCSRSGCTLLEVARARPRDALGIPLLMPLWANLHGAFVVGLGLLAVEVAAAAWRRDGRGVIRFLTVGVLSAVAVLANPWGAWVLAYAVLLPTNRVVTGMVSEWAPASLRDPAGAMLLVSVGVLVVAAARSCPQARAPQQLLRKALLVGLALWAVRASVWFGLALPVALCTLAREPSPRPAEADRGKPLASGLCSSRWR